MHFRGCSGEPNRLSRSYHSGETGDLSYVLHLLRCRFPGPPLAAYGVSLGGNVLLKYLGESGSETPLSAAAASSVPFTLANAAMTLQEGFARLYQSYLLRGLIASMRAKLQRLSPPFPLPDLDSLKTIYDFDDRITAPLHGFEGADDYYARSSSRQFLAGIGIPTLVLHALDDPFMTPAGIPCAAELAESVVLELSQQGGHMGFVHAGHAYLPRFWLAEHVPAWLHSRLDRTTTELRRDRPPPDIRSASA
jgi:predicted alpha/beta-fold hydrolase